MSRPDEPRDHDIEAPVEGAARGRALPRRALLAGLGSLTVSAVTPRLVRAAPRAPQAADWAPQAASFQAECPDNLACHLGQAGAGRYTRADRPRDNMDIRYIVIHDTESSYEQTLDWFSSPANGDDAHATTHYVIRASDGRVAQVLPTRHVAYHTGNFWYNMHSIGIEHEGYMDHGHRWYSEDMYRSSAKLVRHLAARFDIPLDRDHIIGHEEIPAEQAEGTIKQHVDPGPFWNWDYYFELLGAPLHAGPPDEPGEATVVAIAPRFADNFHSFRGSFSGDADLGRQSSNVIYLYTEPDDSSPLLTDPALHTWGYPGTTETADWSARAMSGQRFVVAERVGRWTAIWFGGKRGWFLDPDREIGRPVPGRVIAPRPGRSSIPIYGTAYPERSAFPKPLVPDDIVPLQYRIPAGQCYPAIAHRQSDDYQGSAAHPENRSYVTGDRELYEISFNHRRAFVDADDVHVVD